MTAWTRLIHVYLLGRAVLGRVYLLIDARHGFKSADEPLLDALGKAAVSHQIVLTKCDRVSAADLTACTEATMAALKKRPAAFPETIATSSRTGVGIPELRAAIGRFVTERTRPANAKPGSV